MAMSLSKIVLIRLLDVSVLIAQSPGAKFDVDVTQIEVLHQHPNARTMAEAGKLANHALSKPVFGCEHENACRPSCQRR